MSVLHQNISGKNHYYATNRNMLKISVHGEALIAPHLLFGDTESRTQHANYNYKRFCCPQPFLLSIAASIM